MQDLPPCNLRKCQVDKTSSGSVISCWVVSGIQLLICPVHRCTGTNTTKDVLPIFHRERANLPQWPSLKYLLTFTLLSINYFVLRAVEVWIYCVKPLSWQGHICDHCWYHLSLTSFPFNLYNSYLWLWKLIYVVWKGDTCCHLGNPTWL